MGTKYVRLFRNGLIGAYIAIPPAVTLGTYEGWLFQSSTQGAGIAGGGLLALIAATMLAEYAEVFEPARAGREVLRAVVYFVGTLVWVVVAAALLPQNRPGTAVLVGPLAALMLASVFHFCRFMGMCTRSFHAAILSSATVPVAALPATTSSSLRGIVSTGELGEVERLDIAANTWNIALRLFGGIAAFLILAQVLRRGIDDGLTTTLCYLGAIVLGGMALRFLAARGPALSLDTNGIALRRDLCAIRQLWWAQIIGFEMKSSMANTFLVIHVKDANELIAKRGPIARWFMGQSQAMFGSPVRIPVASLNCDRNWLWQRVNEMLVRSRTEKPK